jgi:hypothetical protein
MTFVWTGSLPSWKSSWKDSMLNFSLSIISVRAKQLQELLPASDQKKALVDQVIADITALTTKQVSNAPYEKDEAWNELHRLERILALAEPKENLLGEIQRRLNDLDDEAMASAARSRTRFETLRETYLDTTEKKPPIVKDDGEKVLRSFLLELVEEIQYFHTREHSLRPLKKKLAVRIAFIGLLAFTAMLYPYLHAYWNIWYSSNDELSLEGWASLPLYTAVTAGLFGACFSRLHFLQAHWDEIPYGEINEALDTSAITLRACVGMTGAVIVFFFLQSGVVGGGGLVPDFSKLGVDHSHFPILPPAQDPNKLGDLDVLPLHLFLPNKQLALLIVWSFLAGFSERLVPSILESSEGTVNAGAAAGSPK